VERPAAAETARWRRAFWLPVGIAALLLQATLFWLEHQPSARRLWGDEVMYLDLAARQAHGEVAPIELLWPPLYPRFLAGLLWLGGGSRIPIELAQVCLLVLAALVVRDLAARAAHAPRAGDVAAALVLLDPQLAAFGHYLWPETLHLALFLAALWLLVSRSERPSRLIAAGLLLGLALLAKSLLTPFVPVLLVPLFRGGFWRGCRRASLVVLTLALVVAPDVLANGQRHGRYVIADSSRFNLLVGLLDRSRRNLVDEVVGDEFGRWKASAPDAAGRDAVLGARLRGLVETRGVLPLLQAQLGRQWFRLLHRDSFLTDQLPGGAIANLGFGYVSPAPALAGWLRVWSYGVYTLALLLFWIGVASLPVRGDLARTLLAFLAYNLLLLLFLHVKTRYRVQILPICHVFAGAAWTHALRATPRALGLAALAFALTACLIWAG
jgi:hypothetical protein